MKRIVKSFAAVILVGIVLTSTASAELVGTVNLQGHNNGLSDVGQLWGGGLGGGSYYTGVYSWTNAGGTGKGTDVPNWGFCIELPQSPYTGWQDVLTLDEAPMPSQYGTPMGMAKANAIRELWGRDFAATVGNAQLGEAFGAAIWEIIYETDTGPWDVLSGTGFHATGIEQAATANLWLSQLNGDATRFANNLYATSSLDGQDYVVQTPEPATIGLLGLGALSLLRRKK